MRKDVQRISKSQDQSERKHTQHDMIEQAKSSVFGRESKKLTSGRGTYLSEQHAVKYEIDRAERIQTQEHVRPDASH
jgi:hypothetical protein